MRTYYALHKIFTVTIGMRRVRVVAFYGRRNWVVLNWEGAHQRTHRFTTYAHRDDTCERYTHVARVSEMKFHIKVLW